MKEKVSKSVVKEVVKHEKKEVKDAYKGIKADEKLVANLRKSDRARI